MTKLVSGRNYTDISLILNVLQFLLETKKVVRTHIYHNSSFHFTALLKILLKPSFQISAPSDLTVLMSAVRVGEPQTSGGKRIHRFDQKIPIQVSLKFRSMPNISIDNYLQI